MVAKEPYTHKERLGSHARGLSSPFLKLLQRPFVHSFGSPRVRKTQCGSSRLPENTMISKSIIDTDFPKVSPLALVEQAARCMRDNHLHALPVVEGNRFRGIIACEDLVYRGIADGEDWFLARVEHYMTSDPDIALVTDGVATVHSAMRAGQHRWLPVIKANEEYQGVVRLEPLEKELRRRESSLPKANFGSPTSTSLAVVGSNK